MCKVIIFFLYKVGNTQVFSNFAGGKGEALQPSGGEQDREGGRSGDDRGKEGKTERGEAKGWFYKLPPLTMLIVVV